MQFSGEGYIIKLKNHGEKSMIATLVCPEYGKIVGYINGAHSKRGLGILSIRQLYFF